MSDQDTQEQYDIPARVTLSPDCGVGYVYLTNPDKIYAVHRTVVICPIEERGEINLDFDANGRLLGVEFMDHRMVPPRSTCDCGEHLSKPCCSENKAIHRNCDTSTILWCSEHMRHKGCRCSCHVRPLSPLEA